MAGIGILTSIIILAIAVVVIAGMWKAFQKAGQPGWGCIVPFYNYYLLTQIAGRPGWWMILMLIPYLNLIFFIIVFVDISKKFGQSGWFGVGLFFLGIVFWPILGFGDAQYETSTADLDQQIDSFGSKDSDTNTEAEENKS